MLEKPLSVNSVVERERENFSERAKLHIHCVCDRASDLYLRLCCVCNKRNKIKIKLKPDKKKQDNNNKQPEIELKNNKSYLKV
jgi:hypothetical protein